MNRPQPSTPNHQPPTYERKCTHQPQIRQTSKIMGGNATHDKELRTLEAEGITRDFETPAEAHERYKKQQIEAQRTKEK